MPRRSREKSFLPLRATAKRSADKRSMGGIGGALRRHHLISRIHFQEVCMAGPETTSDKRKPDAAKSAVAEATSYVGSPAVGTSKAAAAAAVASIGPDHTQANAPRPRLVWSAPARFPAP